MERIVHMYNRTFILVAMIMLVGTISAWGTTCTSVRSGSWNSKGTWIRTRTGTISTTIGSAALSGSGTAFLTELAAGDTVVLQSAPTTVVGVVLLVTGNTTAVLTAGAGATVGGAFGKRDIPGSTDSVVIRSGDTVTLNNTSSCGHVKVNDSSSGSGSSALLLNGNTLTIAGRLWLCPASTGTTTTIVDIGSGTLNVDSILIAAGTNANRSCECRIGTGMLTVSKNINFTGTVGNTKLTYTGAGTVSIGGDLGSGGTVTTVVGATTRFNGTGSQSVGAYVYATLVIAKTSGTATLAGTAGITGNLTVSQGTFDLDTATCDRSGSGGILSIGDNGILIIRGTHTCPSGFTTITLAPLSTVKYIGSGQTIAAATYGNLTIDGTGKKILGGNVSVADTLSMQASDIETGAYSLTIGTSLLSIGALVRVSGTIYGCLNRWVPALLGSVLFPVGCSTHYAGLTLSFTIAPLLGGTLNVCFDSTAPGTGGLPITDGVKTIVNIAKEGFWTVAPGNGIGTGTFSLDLAATSFAGVNDATTLAVLYRPDSSSSWGVTGSTSGGTGTLLAPVAHRLGVGTYGQFGLGGGSDNVLPVEMAGFSGRWGDGGVRLSWRTASEVNNVGFVLARAEHFEGPYQPIVSYMTDTQLRGLGTSPVGAEYTYTDHDGLRPGISYYYVLRQVDLDGQVHEVPTKVTVLVAGQQNDMGLVGAISQKILVQPCPSTGPITLSFLAAVSGPGTFSLYDRLGRLVDHHAIDIQTGVNTVTGEMGDLPPGSYTAQIELGAQRGFGSVVIVH